MTRFFDFLHSQRRVIFAAFAALALLGIASGLRLPAGLLPDVTFPRISVIAECGERPGEEVLRAVTRPLEEAVHGVPNVLEMRSITSRGSAEINLDCRWRTDMNLALQRVQARIDAVRSTLPEGTTVEARQMDPVLFPVLGISLTSTTRSPAELRDLAVTVIRPELARLSGVADVVVQGGRRLEARVVLDPGALQARGLDAAAVAEAVKRAGSIESVGLLEANHELYLGLADARPYSLDDLGALPVPLANGPAVPLRELGRISLEEAPEFTRYAAQGREAVLVNVLRQPTSSTLEVADGVNRWFRDSSSSQMRDVKTEVFYDQSDLVRSSVGSVWESLIIGAILAVLIVGLFLRSPRLGLAAALILPASISLTCLGLGLAHKSFNMMTLGGIAAAVGLVLDDAIVVVEQLAHGAAREKPIGISEAMAQIFPSLVGSSLCTILIFLPFMMLEGVTGAFFRILAFSMVLMLGSSLAVCLAVLPLLSRVGRGRGAAARPGGAGAAVTGNTAAAGMDVTTAVPRGRKLSGRRLIAGAVSRWWIAPLVLAGLIAAIVPLYSTLGSGFLPEMDEGAIILDFILPPGTSLIEADAMLRRLEEAIRTTPEIVSWSRRTGDQLGFFITEPNIGDYVLRLKDGKRRSAEEIEEDLRTRIEASVPAAEIEFGQLVEDAIGDLTSSARPIEVRIFGEDRPLIEAKARQAAQLLAGIPGVVDINDGTTVSGPDFMIRPGSTARRLGLSGGDLARAIEPVVAGLDAGMVVRGARAWPIRLVLAPAGGTADLRTIGQTAVPVAPGKSMRLEDLASIKVDPGETEINRDNLRTMVPVTARLSGRDLGTAMAEVRKVLQKSLPIPADVTIRYAGQWAEQQSSFRGLAAVLLGAAAAVLLLLVASFRSWGLSLAVIAVVAASLCGVFAALHLGATSFNISSFVGAIMVVGIVSENAYFVVLEHRRGLIAGLDPAAAAVAAALRRARPVLMTTLAGIAALAPLALQWNRGSAMLSPLALSVVGGFVVSAPLLLLVLPSLLARAGRDE